MPSTARSFVCHDKNIYTFANGQGVRHKPYVWREGKWDPVSFGTFYNAVLNGKAISAKEAEEFIACTGREFVVDLP